MFPRYTIKLKIRQGGEEDAFAIRERLCTLLAFIGPRILIVSFRL